MDAFTLGGALRSPGGGLDDDSPQYQPARWLISIDLDGNELTRWPAAISVGTNPTFGGTDRTVEAYALDRDDLDLYGLHMAVDFVARLRGMVRFDSAGALTEQMRRDVDEARDLIGGPR